MPPVRGPEKTKMPFGTSCSKNLPGSRGTSHNKHIAHQPQPPIPPPARPEENRSHSQRPTFASRGPTGSRYHFGLTPDRLEPAPPKTRQLRRSRPDRCPTFQRTHLTRASPSTTLKTGGPWNRSPPLLSDVLWQTPCTSNLRCGKRCVAKKIEQEEEWHKSLNKVDANNK